MHSLCTEFKGPSQLIPLLLVLHTSRSKYINIQITGSTQTSTLHTAHRYTSSIENTVHSK